MSRRSRFQAWLHQHWVHYRECFTYQCQLQEKKLSLTLMGHALSILVTISDYFVELWLPFSHSFHDFRSQLQVSDGKAALCSSSCASEALRLRCKDVIEQSIFAFIATYQRHA
jgi:hypothetical protein